MAKTLVKVFDESYFEKRFRDNSGEDYKVKSLCLNRNNDFFLIVEYQTPIKYKTALDLGKHLKHKEVKSNDLYSDFIKEMDRFYRKMAKIYMAEFKRRKIKNGHRNKDKSN